MRATPSPLETLVQAVAQASVLVFDFDGTLVDSNAIKRQAFDRCFSEFPDRLEEIRRYCYGFNHTPRWEKFRHVYTEILGLPYTPEIEREMHRRYEEATTLQVIRAPEIPGAGNFLEAARSRHPLALVSSTPDPILRTILKARGWSRLFHVVQGAPVRKADWLAGYLRQEHHAPGNVVFFGDALEDAASAKQAGCLFCGIANEELRSQAAFWVNDFVALLDDTPADLPTATEAAQPRSPLR